MKIWIYVLDEGVVPGKEEFHERRLLCQVLWQKMEEDLIVARIPSRFVNVLANVRPGCNIAIEYENKPEDRHFTYRTLSWAEILPAPLSSCAYIKLKTG